MSDRTGTLVAADGVRLAVHRWTAPAPRAAVCYLHGIQSHAGWLFDTGPELAARGVEVHALDRRGSGRSDGRRGDLESAELVLDDHHRFLVAAAERAGGLPVVAVGQSFGGSVLAALWATRPLPVDALVFCAPALGQQRHRHGAATLTALRRLTGTDPWPIPLADRDYTDEQRYLAFMANDHLMLRQATRRTRATMVALEDAYAGKPDALPALPVHLVVPTVDPIIHLDSAVAVLERLAVDLTVRRLPADRHYLEFTAARAELWDWLAETAATTPAKARELT